MPWGKFKDEELENVPSDYLEYALREFNLTDALMEEMDAQLRMRAGEGVSRGNRK